MTAERLVEQRLGTVVPLLGEIGEAELERDHAVVRHPRPGPLQKWDGPGGLPLSHVDDAGVVESLDVVRLYLESSTEIVQRAVVALVVEIDDGLPDVHVGLGALGLGGQSGKTDEHEEGEANTAPHPHGPVYRAKLFNQLTK